MTAYNVYAGEATHLVGGHAYRFRPTGKITLHNKEHLRNPVTRLSGGGYSARLIWREPTMEPNEALRELRVALAILLPRRARLVALAADAYKRDELDDLIDAAAALDAWMSKGGWLPDAWSVRASNPDGVIPNVCPCEYCQQAARATEDGPRGPAPQPGPHGANGPGDPNGWRHEPDPFPSSPKLVDDEEVRT